MRRLLFALALLGCGPDREASCERLCSMTEDVACGGGLGSDLDECNEGCTAAVADERCGQALDALDACVGDGECPEDRCADEAEDLATVCDF